MPVTAMAKSAPNFFARAFGHFARHGLAHRAVPRQGCGPDTEKFSFGLVAVSHQPAEKDLGRAGHVRDPVRDQTAGAGFRQGQLAFLLRQNADDGRLDFTAAWV